MRAWRESPSVGTGLSTALPLLAQQMTGGAASPSGCSLVHSQLRASRVADTRHDLWDRSPDTAPLLFVLGVTSLTVRSQPVIQPRTPPCADTWRGSSGSLVRASLPSSWTHLLYRATPCACVCSSTPANSPGALAGPTRHLCVELATGCYRCACSGGGAGRGEGRAAIATGRGSEHAAAQGCVRVGHAGGGARAARRPAGEGPAAWAPVGRPSWLRPTRGGPSEGDVCVHFPPARASDPAAAPGYGNAAATRAPTCLPIRFAGTLPSEARPRLVRAFEPKRHILMPGIIAARARCPDARTEG